MVKNSQKKPIKMKRKINTRKNRRGGSGRGKGNKNYDTSGMFAFRKGDSAAEALSGMGDRMLADQKEEERQQRTDKLKEIKRLNKTDPEKARSEQATLDYKDLEKKMGVSRTIGTAYESNLSKMARLDDATAITRISKNFQRVQNRGPYIQRSKYERENPGDSGTELQKSFYAWQQWYQNDAPHTIRMLGEMVERKGHGPLDITQKDGTGKDKLKKEETYRDGNYYTEEVPIYINRKGYDDAKKQFENSKPMQDEFLEVYNEKYAKKSPKKSAKESAKESIKIKAPAYYTWNDIVKNNLSLRLSKKKGFLMASVKGATTDEEADVRYVNDISNIPEDIRSDLANNRNKLTYKKKTWKLNKTTTMYERTD